ncbi:hypothetical protein [Brucella intermedia]|uniref:hypothetical protein n=1 Tax=Brucella intermedia TaxID=94625 RepID=UPI00224AA9E0|nr:hypothetical protein [Brucella intermedia]
MSEIPDDVMTAAVGVKTLLRFTPETEWGSIIARAILAERQRCADVAGSYGTIPGYPDGKTGAFRKHRHRIRQAILAGAPA